jgi:hypothetical protein
MSTNLTKAEKELVASILSTDYFILLERAVASRFGTSSCNKEAHAKVLFLIDKVKKERF